MNTSELRVLLSSQESIAADPFAVMQNLCAVFNNGVEEGEKQELLLRALEYREAFGGCKEILHALVREAGLFPYLDPEELDFADRLAYEYHRPPKMDWEGIAFVFHRPQARVYRELMAGHSVILSAPTSFGKSLIIDAVIASGKFKNILIVVPTIALIDETRRRLSRFRDEYRVVTHVFQESGERNIFIFTQERALNHPCLDQIEFFEIDEFYKLATSRNKDPKRAILLNQIFYSLARRGVQFYMLGPSIENIPLAQLRSRIECLFLVEPYNTVVSETHRILRSQDDFEKLAELCSRLDEPTMIYCRSPARAAEVAKALVDYGVQKDSDLPGGTLEWLGREYHPQWHFARALSRGVGIHHGRVPRALAQFITRAFDSGWIKLLVCTSTLIEGVNTKAKNIIIFDNKLGRAKYDFFTFNNIRGRSGRMFQHFIGHVYMFHDAPERELPFVDIPAFTQSEDTPESLLLQLDEDDLLDASKEKLAKYRDQEVVSYSTLKKNVGVDLDAQLSVAEDIVANIDDYWPLMRWSQIPEYDEIKLISQLIWDHFNGSKLAARYIRTPNRLAYLINSLKRRPGSADLIRSEIEFRKRCEPDDVVAFVLAFLRSWANFHFPRLLRAIDFIQRDIFERHNLDAGDYELFASKVENFFLDPTLLALDEYGLPIQVGRKLTSLLNPNGDLDEVLSNLRSIRTQALNLTEFEKDLIHDIQRYL